VIPAALGVAALIGLVNGIGVVAFGVSPIIMTMGMNVIAEGMLLVYTGGVQPPGAPNFINQLGAGRAGPIPIATLIWLALSVLAVLGLSLMTFGRRLYAIGTSRTVARLSGLNVNWTPLITYVISALAAGVAGLVLTGYTGEAYLGMGDPYLFPSVAAVAIGGAPLLGGGGHYIGTIAGALVLTVLAGLLPALNLPPGWTDVIYGVTIIVTVAVATSRRSGEAV
jgi:ribose transport system permease protein